jgi:alcohol dehydrogenase
MIAHALGAQIVAVDINDSALDIAKEFGAFAAINASRENNLVEHVKSITHGGAHVSVDALGSATTCFNSVANLRKRGKHIQVGLMTGDHRNAHVPMDKVLADELEIIGSHGMQAFRYPEMLEMIRSGKLHPEKLIHKTISLEEAATALPEMDRFRHHGVLVIDRL